MSETVSISTLDGTGRFECYLSSAPVLAMRGCFPP